MNDLPELIAWALLAWATPEALAICAGWINRLLKSIAHDD